MHPDEHTNHYKQFIESGAHLWMIGFFVLLLILGGAYVLAKIGPKTVKDSDVARVMERPPQVDQETVARVREILEKAETAKVENPEHWETVELMNGAITLLDESELDEDLFGVSVSELRRERDQLAGEILSGEINDTLSEARSAFRNKDYGSSTMLFRKALSLQERLQDQYPLSRQSGSSMVIRVQKELEESITQPMSENIDELVAEARQARAENNEPKAMEHLGEAVSTMRELLSKYPRSRFARVSRLDALENELRATQLSEQLNHLKVLVKRAQDALAAGRYEEAIQHFERAVELNASLSDSYDLEVTDPGYTLSDLQDALYEARRIPQLVDLAETLRLLEQDLAERRTLHAEERLNTLLVQWYTIKRGGTITFGLISGPDDVNLLERIGGLEDLELKVPFFESMKGKFGPVQDDLYQRLIEFPGKPGMRILSTEVDQSLFSTIMSTNPSVHTTIEGNSTAKPGDLPVDSVSWNEATEFCRRVQWLLGHPVRLPSFDEFRGLVERLHNRAPPAASKVWSIEQGERETQPVNSLAPDSLGLRHLLGNVSEWCQDGRDPNTRYVVGGTLRDPYQALLAGPSELRSPRDRFRYLGFRILVDMSEAP